MLKLLLWGCFDGRRSDHGHLGKHCKWTHHYMLTYHNMMLLMQWSLLRCHLAQPPGQRYWGGGGEAYGRAWSTRSGFLPVFSLPWQRERLNGAVTMATEGISIRGRLGHIIRPLGLVMTTLPESEWRGAFIELCARKIQQKYDFGDKKTRCGIRVCTNLNFTNLLS